MEKSKKILYLIAGILKIVGGAVVALIGGVMFLIMGIMRSVFESSKETVSQMMEALAKADEDYAYLLESGLEEQLDFIMNICKIFALVLVVLAIVYIIVGIINIKFSKRTGMMAKEGIKSVLLCIVSWVLSFLALSTILTTVAACLKAKNSNGSDNVVIEQYHV